MTRYKAIRRLHAVESADAIILFLSNPILHALHVIEGVGGGTADHKANTKVKTSIDIYEFWDFKNVRKLSKDALIKKNQVHR